MYLCIFTFAICTQFSKFCLTVLLLSTAIHGNLNFCRKGDKESIIAETHTKFPVFLIPVFLNKNIHFI